MPPRLLTLTAPFCARHAGTSHHPTRHDHTAHHSLQYWHCYSTQNHVLVYARRWLRLIRDKADYQYISQSFSGKRNDLL